MKRFFAATAIILAAAAPHALAQGKAPIDLVKQAVAAEGGADKLRALKRLSITAQEVQWEPEQSLVAGGPPREVAHFATAMRWDLEKGTERSDLDHTILYFLPGQEKYTEIVTPTAGAIVTDKGQRPMSGARLALDQRELERASPVLLLKALDQPANVSGLPDQPLGKARLPAVAFKDGGTAFQILFDRKTHLPAAIRTQDGDIFHADANFDLLFGDWKDVAGVKIAHALEYTLGGTDRRKIAYTAVTANPSFPDDSFAITDEVRQAAKGPASGDVAWQEMLVSRGFGRWDDLQAEKNQQAGLSMALNELAPNVQHAKGSSHNSLIVAMPHYLVVFDAPLSEAQSKWTIDAAKAKYPGKPIKYLVLTHHHFDHILGARTYVAEGATVIVGKPDKAHVAKMFTATHSMHPDALQLRPRPAKIVEVADRMALKDGSSEIDVIRIENPHAEGMLIGYVLPEKVVWVTDLYSPGQPKNPGVVAFHDSIAKLGLTPAWYAGGHGGSIAAAKFDELVAAK